MLSPEVWHFAVSRSTECVEEISKECIFKHDDDDGFNTIALICPDLYRAPDDWLKILTNGSYYELTDCSPNFLTQQEFIEYFVKNGEVQCFSTKSHADIDSLISLNSTGILVIHSSKEIYQTLGLNGVKHDFQFYETRIDLKTHLPGNKQHARAESALKKLGTFNLILNWEPHDENICPSTIAKYFHDKGVTVAGRDPDITEINHAGIKVPQLDKELVKEILEWTGLLAVGGDTISNNEYVSSYGYAGNTIDMCSIASTVRAHGLFSKSATEKVLAAMRRYIDGRDSTLWIAIILVNDRNTTKNISYFFSKDKIIKIRNSI